ncbi:MAG: HIT domain-containing protein [Candidatus Magasanikbacteria bacterium]
MPELRKHPILKDWVMIDPKRVERHLHIDSGGNFETDKSKCPFQDLSSNEEDPILSYSQDSDLEGWTLQVIKNKFPAVEPENNSSVWGVGPYKKRTAHGYHELLVTKSHHEDFDSLKDEEAFDVFRALQERYRALSQRNRVQFVSMFHNWGKRAGASVYHPHYQIISLPVVPSGTKEYLEGSRRYKEKNGTCGYCDMIQKEQEDGTRVVFENEKVICFVPFASKAPFEMRIFPKEHSPYFRREDERVLKEISFGLKNVIKSLKRNLSSPDYNFFIHSAPAENDEFNYFHWHIEVRPRVIIPGGLEKGTGMYVNVVSPESAAKVLNGISAGFPEEV